MTKSSLSTHPKNTLGGLRLGAANPRIPRPPLLLYPAFPPGTNRRRSSLFGSWRVPGEEGRARLAVSKRWRRPGALVVETRRRGRRVRSVRRFGCPHGRDKDGLVRLVVVPTQRHFGLLSRRARVPAARVLRMTHRRGCCTCQTPIFKNGAGNRPPCVSRPKYPARASPRSDPHSTS